VPIDAKVVLPYSGSQCSAHGCLKQNVLLQTEMTLLLYLDRT
jgi:hypothetical protein